MLRTGKIMLNYNKPGLINNDTLLYEFEVYYKLFQQEMKKNGKQNK